MIYWHLFLGFLRVGCFAFGGAYGAIPLIREVVLSYGWLTEEMLAYMIAVSESTPGPIMVNLATYVGSSQAGFFGAVVATLSVVLPSFVIILLVMAAFRSLLKHPYMQAILRGLKPCIIGIILATGVSITISNCFSSPAGGFEPRSFLITAVLAALAWGTKPVLKKKISPILLIVVSAGLGICVYGF